MFISEKACAQLYLIHEPYRSKETRRFANRLRKEGFDPLVAHDFRSKGERVVSQAIDSCDYSLVLAFDKETVETCMAQGVPVFLLDESQGQA